VFQSAQFFQDICASWAGRKAAYGRHGMNVHEISGSVLFEEAETLISEFMIGRLGASHLRDDQQTLDIGG